MRLHLNPTVYAARLQEDLVILDAARGDYFCLPGAGLAADPVAGDNGLEVTGAELADGLCELGLASREGPIVPRPEPLPPRRDIGPAGGAVGAVRPSVRQQLDTMLSGLGLLRSYWRRSFADIVGPAGEAASDGPEPSPSLVQQARVFAALLPWIPFQGECLYRSFLLRSYLARSGHAVRFVVGVRTYPFEAHCWLQAGDMVLDDAAEHAAAFTPILVR